MDARKYLDLEVSMISSTSNNLSNNSIEGLHRTDAVNPLDLDNNFKYLDFKQFNDGDKIKALAYVNEVRASYSVKETGYFTFYVKDINAVTIACRMFDIDGFIDKGFNALYLKHKPVLIKAKVQNYYGTWSLIVEDIEIWTGDFDYENVIGKMDIEAEFSSVFSTLQNAFPEDKSTFDAIKGGLDSSIATICDGKKGGPAALFSFVFRELWSNSVINYMDCIRVWIYMYLTYIEYEYKKNQFSILTHKEKLNIINSKCCWYENDRLADIISNACYSVVGLSSPDNYYSVLLTKLIEQYDFVYNLGKTFEKLPQGSTVNFRGNEITKY